MMSKTTSRRKALLLQWTIAPVITALALSFCIVVIAQEKAPKSIPELQIKEYTRDGASPELMKEFDDIVKKRRDISNGGITYKPFLKEERERLLTIYKTMNREQQDKAEIFFIPWPWPKPSDKKVLTAAQLEDFSNPNKYGVRIDGYLKSNETLKKYQPSDFSYYSAYRLYGAARKSPHQNYQVDLMTNNHFKKVIEESNSGTRMIFRNSKLPKSPTQTR